LPLATSPADDRESLGGIESNLGIVLTALGRCKEAEQAYRRAFAIHEKLAGDYPASPSYRHDLSSCLNNFGNLLTATGRFREAEKLLSRSLEIRERLATDYPTYPAYRQALAVSHTSFGGLLAATARYPEATEHDRQSQAILEKLTKDFPATPTYRQELASNAVGFGCVSTALGRFNDAEKSHRQALALREALAAECQSTISFRQEVAASHAYLGQLAFLTGKSAEAERAFRQALIHRQKLVDEDAGSGRHRCDLAASHHELANVLARLGRLSEAEFHYRQALVLNQKLEIPNPKSETDVRIQFSDFGFRISDLFGFDRLEWASCRSDLAALLNDLGRYGDAETELRNSLDALRRLMDELPEVAAVRMAMCVGLDRLSWVYQNTGRAAEAEKSLSLAAALAEKCSAEIPANPDFRRQHAHLQIRQATRLAAGGQTRQAEETFSKGLSLLAKLADDYPAVPEFRRELAQGLDLLGCLLVREGRKSAGAQTFRQVRQLREELIRNLPEPVHVQEMAWFLATCPDESFRDPKVALQMAERAVAFAPEQGDCWSALGIAHYRNGEWKKGEAALQQAIQLRSGGGCADWLFLAITCRQLGELGQARQWFEKAAAWMEQNQPVAEDLTRFRAEAEIVMTKDSRSDRHQIEMGDQ
jgi:tetratricopeptide (TPR) repeat protein